MTGPFATTPTPPGTPRKLQLIWDADAERARIDRFRATLSRTARRDSRRARSLRRIAGTQRRQQAIFALVAATCGAALSALVWLPALAALFTRCPA